MKTMDRAQAPAAASADVKTMTMIEAITQGLAEEMERDERIFLIGEEYRQLRRRV
jgi:hypothetical protein